MTIASALQDLANDITNARSAVVAKGGTITPSGGSSQLATDISTIPSGGVPDVSTSAEMDANLTAENVGKMYRYTGTTTANYVNGRYYLVNNIYVVPEIEFSGFTSYGFENSTVLDLDPNVYSGPYQSTNYGVNNSYAVAKIKIKDADRLILWFNSYAESRCDYTIISNLDATTYPTSSSSSTFSTYNFQRNPRNGLNTENWIKYTFTLPDDNEHYVWVVYRKDASMMYYDDRGYFVVEKMQRLFYKEYLTPMGNLTITDTSVKDVSTYKTAQVVDNYLLPENIKKDVDILGVTGTFGGGGGGGGYKVYFTIGGGGDNGILQLNGETAQKITQSASTTKCINCPASGIRTIKMWGFDHISHDVSSSASYARWCPHGTSNWTFIQITRDEGSAQTLTLTTDIDMEIFENTCLDRNTPITMADGSKKIIREIKKGDKVKGYNGHIYTVYKDEYNNTAYTEYRDVWTFENGYQIITTHQHRFYNLEHQKMMYLQDWQIGEHAYTEDGKAVALLEHKRENEICHYHSLWCNESGEEDYSTPDWKDGNTYFAGGLLAGNRFTPDIKIEVENEL